MTFFDGTTEEKFTEDLGYFEGYKERTLKLHIGGPADIGTLWIDDEEVLVKDESFWEALKIALNRLTI